MSPRKPLEEGCTGDIWCALYGHQTARRHSGGTWYSHVPLTPGQTKTLYERQEAAREKEKKS